MNVTRPDWLWLIIGIIFGVVVVPMLQAWWASRGSAGGHN